MKNKTLDLTGQRFGKLVVISKTISDNYKSRWLCQCDCGNQTIVLIDNLKSGHTKSCGCFRKELRVKHNMCGISVYNIWVTMNQRCNNKKHIGYKNYGGRGITVCNRWHQFESFYKDMGDRPEGLTLERINNNSNYELSNCKWATQREQANNTRRNVIIEYLGQKKTIAQWARKLGIKYVTLYQRLQHHWPIKKALEI